MTSTDPHIWLLGAGGLLGRAMSAATSAWRHEPNRPVPWSDHAAFDSLRQRAHAFASAGPDWVAVWSAGAGIIGTDVETLERETGLLRSVLEGLSDSPYSGTIVLTSSAGGVYAGSHSMPISEHDDPVPTSDYGRNKLVQEAMVSDFARRCRHRALIGRVSNLYGPGQNQNKPQGLVTHIVKSTLLRRPVPLYVSLDTIRDYVFVEDCARTMATMIVSRARLEPGETKMKIVASGSSISIGGLLAETQRVLGRRPTVVLAPSTRSAMQAKALAFRSETWCDLDCSPRTPLPVGIDRTAQDLRRQLMLGLLNAA